MVLENLAGHLSHGWVKNSWGKMYMNYETYVGVMVLMGVDCIVSCMGGAALLLLESLALRYLP